ncbi:MAG: LLM class F420-dependent oxidoreductase [Candidatus Binatia bacterium]
MKSHPTRFGVQTAQQNVEWLDLLDFWRQVDGFGYDSLWNFDHFYPIFTNPDGPCFEGWTTLAALAQATKRARIGTLVNGNTYRNPALTAKMAATVDHVSGGRLNLGIGAGWFELEHKALGFDFRTVRGRLEALDEACRILKGMFTEERTTVRGKHYTVVDALGYPKPLQKPHPPIMIGGTGQKVLLKIVAKYADLWNTAGSAERMKELIDVIARHGDAVGRDTAEIEKTVFMPFAYGASKEGERRVLAMAAGMDGSTPDAARPRVMIGSKQECLDTVERYAKVGVTHFIFMCPPPFPKEGIQRFAEEVIAPIRSA